MTEGSEPNAGGTAFARSPYPVFLFDSNMIITDANPAALKLLDTSAKESVTGKHFSAIVAHEDREKLDTFLYKLMRFGVDTCELVLVTEKSKHIYAEIQANCIFSNDTDCKSWVVIVTGSGDKKVSSAEIKYLSVHDKLTGLYNRGFFENEILHQKKMKDYPVSIIMGDMNSLKMANDIFGHEEGDAALKKIASIFKKCCRKSDTIARWGGDEFAVVLPKAGEEDVTAICERIRDTCKKETKGKIIYSISIGYATTTNTGKSIMSAVKEAEAMMYKKKMTESKRVRSIMLKSLSDNLMKNHLETNEHIAHIKATAYRLATGMGLKDVDLENIILLADNHDIGKIAIKSEILLKTGKLSRIEWEEIKKHPVTGYRIAELSPEISRISDLILAHHEKWDGTGYPNGLKQKDIPLLCRILQLVDAYDIMISGTVYKPAISGIEAMEEIKRCSGTQFDPEIVEKFVEIVTEGVKE